VERPPEDPSRKNDWSAVNKKDAKTKKKVGIQRRYDS